jgi:uncharacterized membrane protein
MIIDSIVGLVNAALHGPGGKEKSARVIQAFRSRHPVVRDANAAFDAMSSPGDRLADSIARIGGSWRFIIVSLLFLALWVTANSILLRGQLRFDPYPFVFLNLVLSMLAALQAPIIMMSQNRQAAKDRLVANTDYEVNLKAELEILALHEKIDRMEAQQARDFARITELLEARE